VSYAGGKTPSTQTVEWNWTVNGGEGAMGVSRRVKTPRTGKNARKKQYPAGRIDTFVWEAKAKLGEFEMNRKSA